ncbi:MAG: hypothetical protein LBK13_10445, partial [Spirochaetales bacterium]|nr:hypothetical protein [Spirochaetales bacterium]
MNRIDADGFPPFIPKENGPHYKLGAFRGRVSARYNPLPIGKRPSSGAFFCPNPDKKTGLSASSPRKAPSALSCGLSAAIPCARFKRLTRAVKPELRKFLRQFRSTKQSVANVVQMRDVPPGFFAVRRKKTRLYHRRLPPPRLQATVTLAGLEP